MRFFRLLIALAVLLLSVSLLGSGPVVVTSSASFHSTGLLSDPAPVTPPPQQKVSKVNHRVTNLLTYTTTHNRLGKT